MTHKYTNNTNLSLSMAVFLADDRYDHSNDPKKISVTTLIRSTKQIILGSRVDPTQYPVDITSVLKSQCGTAIHTAVEEAWLNNYQKSMKDLGYGQKMIDRIKVNPTQKELDEYKADLPVIPVYLEQRSSKKINDFTVSGKFDLVMDGVLEDVKNTSTYTYIYKSNDKSYQLQGSIYKWLNPDKITADHMLIQYIFTDWTANAFKANPRNYPSAQQLAYKIPLMPVQQTEAFVNNKINELDKLWNLPESDLPDCTDEELWKNPSVWKYYKNPQKTSRSTRNFDNPSAAYAAKAADGNVGIVKEIKGTAKACAYCSAFPICQQAKQYYPS